MKFLLPGLITLLFSATLYADAKSVFEFNVNNIDGKEVNLADYKGKVLVIVNTASKC